MTRTYCTYFDARYVARGLTMWKSLLAVEPDSQLVVLSLDAETSTVLEAVRPQHADVVELSQLVEAHPQLADARQDRSLVEFYFTLTPFLPQFVLTSIGADIVTYVDADLWFGSSPEPLYGELGHGSIAIVPHRWPARLSHMRGHGIYNVGWITFRADERSRECLTWWGDRCLESCIDRPTAEGFADQGYLDEWPKRFEGVVPLNNPGAGVASWNLDVHPLRWDGTRWMVAGSPLIFFHCHSHTFPLGTSADRLGIHLDAVEADASREAGRLFMSGYVGAVDREQSALEARGHVLKRDVLRGSPFKKGSD